MTPIVCGVCQDPIGQGQEWAHKEDEALLHIGCVARIARDHFCQTRKNQFPCPLCRQDAPCDEEGFPLQNNERIRILPASLQHELVMVCHYGNNLHLISTYYDQLRQYDEDTSRDILTEALYRGLASSNKRVIEILYDQMKGRQDCSSVCREAAHLIMKEQVGKQPAVQELALQMERFNSVLRISKDEMRLVLENLWITDEGMDPMGNAKQALWFLEFANRYNVRMPQALFDRVQRAAREYRPREDDQITDGLQAGLAQYARLLAALPNAGRPGANDLPLSEEDQVALAIAESLETEKRRRRAATPETTDLQDPVLEQVLAASIQTHREEEAQRARPDHLPRTACTRMAFAVALIAWVTWMQFPYA